MNSPSSFLPTISLFLALFLSLFPRSLSALPIDSKFLGKILGLSQTKKTALINKGREIGLKLNDHARISLPNGFVARAVLVRLGPSRSVWSIYRFIHKEKVQTQVVFRFKISSPVQLTSDESKSLGILAKKIDKKREPPKNRKEHQWEKKQNMRKKQWIQIEKRTGQVDGQDYSTLEDQGSPKNLDRDLDWSALDGHKDQEHFDAGLNYFHL